MKIAMTSKITGAISTLVMIVCITMMTGGQAFALTTVSDWAYEANGEPLSWCSDSAGTTINFGLSCNVAWQAQYELSDTNGFKYYYWHPYGDTSLCLTASTTQKGVLKLEGCDNDVSQQLWYNPNSSGNYHLESFYYNDECLYEAGGKLGTGTNFTTDCTYGDNGQTFQQDN